MKVGLGSAPGVEPIVGQPLLTPEELAVHFPQLEILECLGRGGMGVVYKARQPRLNRLVALKILAPERAKDPAFAGRFENEAQALAQLSHPNIVTLYEFGQADGLFYFIMEFVDGVNLRQAMKAGRFTPEQALAVVPPVCEALQYAHNHGIVHRDIKPENLLLDKEGRVKIADFGLAKMLGAGASPVGLAESQPAGTPQYMAPEQQTAPQQVDSRADIYSLGVVLYEMLTGELPGKPLEPPSHKVQIDVRLDAVVLRALEKQPALRYQQVSDVKTMVETIASTPPPAGAQVSAAPQPQRTGKNPPLFVEQDGLRHLYWPGVLMFGGTLGVSTLGTILVIALAVWLLTGGVMFQQRELPWVIALAGVSALMRLAGMKLDTSEAARAASAPTAKVSKTRKVIFSFVMIGVAMMVAIGLVNLIHWLRALSSTTAANGNSLNDLGRMAFERIAAWIAIAITAGLFIIGRVWRAVNRDIPPQVPSVGKTGAADSPSLEENTSPQRSTLFVIRDGKLVLDWPEIWRFSLKFGFLFGGLLACSGIVGYLLGGLRGGQFAVDGMAILCVAAFGVWLAKLSATRFAIMPYPDASCPQSSDWPWWSVLLPPLEREICAHMTASEIRGLYMHGILAKLVWTGMGIVGGACFVSSDHARWIMGGAVFLIAYISVKLSAPGFDKSRRELLCATAWARQQGITPDRVQRFVSEPPAPLPQVPKAGKTCAGSSASQSLIQDIRAHMTAGEKRADLFCGILSVLGILCATFGTIYLGPYAMFGAFVIVFALDWHLKLLASTGYAKQQGVTIEQVRQAFWTVRLRWPAAIVLPFLMLLSVFFCYRLMQHTQYDNPRKEPPRVPQLIASVPEIERVVVSKDQALVTGRSPDAGMYVMIGALTNNDVWVAPHDGMPFTITLTPQSFWRGGYDWVVKASYGNITYRLDSKTGPLTGRIVFQPGTPALAADGSCVIGEFQQVGGPPLPISVRLERDSKPSASPGAAERNLAPLEPTVQTAALALCASTFFQDLADGRVGQAHAKFHWSLSSRWSEDKLRDWWGTHVRCYGKFLRTEEPLVEEGPLNTRRVTVMGHFERARCGFRISFFSSGMIEGLSSLPQDTEANVGPCKAQPVLTGTNTYRGTTNGSSSSNNTAVQKLTFGPVTNGLCAAVELAPSNGVFRLGEPIEVVFHIRNSSSERVFLTGASWRQGDDLMVEDQNGQKIEVHNITQDGVTPIKSEYLLPGWIALFHSARLAFLPEDATEKQVPDSAGYYVKVKPGKYTLRFRLHFSAEKKNSSDWQGDLETAPVTVDVKAAAAKPTPRLQFRLVATANDTAPADTLADPNTKESFRIRKEVLLDETSIISAVVTNGMQKEELRLALTQDGWTRFAAIAGANGHASLAILINGQLCLVPTMSSTIIHGHGEIGWQLDNKDVAKTIVRALNSGAQQQPAASPPTTSMRTIRSIVQGAGQMTVTGTNAYSGTVFTLPPVNGQVASEQAMQARPTKPRSKVGKVSKVHTEKDRASIDAQLGEQEVLLVFIGYESLGWSAGWAKPGFGTATIESSSQIPMEDGSMGKGFLAHVGSVTFDVAITPDGPYPFGELLFREDSKVTENNGTYIFADIHKPDGTLVPVCVGVREQDKVIRERTVSNTSSCRGTTNVNASTTNATLAIVAAALRPVLDRIDPKPAIEFPKGDPQSLEVFCLTQKYTIHEKFKSGRVGTNSYEEVGPSHGGFMLRIHVQPKGDVNQAVTPQTLKEPYWLTDLDVTPIAGADKQIYWALSYAGRSPTNVLSEIRAALKRLEEKK